MLTWKILLALSFFLLLCFMNLHSFLFWRTGALSPHPPGYVSGAPGGVKYFDHLGGGK